jgi:sulfide:quinone oxidoreductase
MSGQPISARASRGEMFHVVIAGGGVAALEALLALHDLASERIAVTLLAPNTHFAYRPLSVREPFAYGKARRYELAPIMRDNAAEHLVEELSWIEPAEQLVHTEQGSELRYDALVLALGARAVPHFEHAITIDDRRLDETLHGLIQDIEGGYLKSVAFVAPGRMAWPLPLYELALMTAGRAYDMDLELKTTLITPEDAPLAIFGANVSERVGERLRAAGIEAICSAYAEVPQPGELVVNPGDRRLSAERIVALPELFGPGLRGIPLGENGFIRVDQFCKVPDVGPVFAAGDATAFTIKHGGLGSQQADVAARSIAALAGADVAPEPFVPVIRGMLLTGDAPLYLAARITGGQGFSSEVSDRPLWSPPAKIASRYLAPYLDSLDRAGATT